jgi:hypothetical protein
MNYLTLSAGKAGGFSAALAGAILAGMGVMARAACCCSSSDDDDDLVDLLPSSKPTKTLKALGLS